MDGAKLKLLMLDYLDEEEETDLYADSRRMFECLDQAAGILCRELQLLHAEEEITTVADTQAYDLPPGFISLQVTNARGRYVAKYYTGDAYSFPFEDEYERIYRSNCMESRDRPTRFAVRDKPEKEDLIQSTCTADAVASGGECTLTDSTMLFTTTNRVHPRDIVHNVDDGSTGYVLSVTDATHVKTALFGGTTNQWTTGDDYVIQPAAEKQLYLDAPSEASGHTITVPYVCMPSPVFSDYGFWRFPPRVCRSLAAGAASIFKLPKRQFTESSQIGGLFGSEIKMMRREIAQRAVHAPRRR